jgi:hypothetical protein
MTTQAQNDQSFESAPLDVIEQGWKTKTINNVINGSLGIMLERFDQTWPTWMGGAIRETMEKGLAKEVLDEETALTVTVNSKNGYVEVDDGGTDGAYMSACVWNRTNGHKLFAVRLGKPTDPFIDFVCFYDYDQQKKCLTPEPEILKGYRWGDKEPGIQLFCKLPKTGKNVVVDEWGDEGPVQHTFTWDGMKPVYAKTEPLEYDDGLSDIPVSFKGAQPNIKDFVSALLAQHSTGEALADLREAWGFYKNGMKLMPGQDLIVDTQNGYMGFTSDESDTDRLVIECCYWNYADGKRKLVAMSNDFFQNGKAIAGQFTGVDFYIYDNASRKMTLTYAQDLGLEFDIPSDWHGTSHALPRQGKTIVYSFQTSSGKVEKRMTWNGSKFIPASK